MGEQKIVITPDEIREHVHRGIDKARRPVSDILDEYTGNARKALTSATEKQCLAYAFLLSANVASAIGKHFYEEAAKPLESDDCLKTGNDLMNKLRILRTIENFAEAKELYRVLQEKGIGGDDIPDNFQHLGNRNIIKPMYDRVTKALSSMDWQELKVFGDEVDFLSLFSERIDPDQHGEAITALNSVCEI